MIALAALSQRTKANYGRSGVPVADNCATRSVPVTLTREQNDWVQQRADELNVSRSAIIRELVAWCIKESGVA